MTKPASKIKVEVSTFGINVRAKIGIASITLSLYLYGSVAAKKNASKTLISKFFPISPSFLYYYCITKFFSNYLSFSYD